MSDAVAVRTAQRGRMTLPRALRETYNLRPGDTFTLLDLGGVFVLVPRRSEMDSIAEGTALALTERGETLETTLQARREDRER